VIKKNNGTYYGVMALCFCLITLSLFSIGLGLIFSIRGKRGRGASGKTIVFGLLKREGNVYTEIVPNCSKVTLQGIIRGHIELDSVINTDGWRGYDGLVDLGYKKHLRVNHGQNKFASGEHHINGIESFWGYAKKSLIKSMELTKRCFICILRKRSIASIIGIVTYTLICLNYSVKTLFSFLSPLLMMPKLSKFFSNSMRSIGSDRFVTQT